MLPKAEVGRPFGQAGFQDYGQNKKGNKSREK
jgi:hypothetical protein